MKKILLAAAMCLLPSLLYANDDPGSGGTGLPPCRVTVMKTCDEMAVKYDGLQGGPCGSTKCIEIDSFWHCPKPIGLEVIVPGEVIRDVENAAKDELGSTWVHYNWFPTDCGQLWTCKCSQFANEETPCDNDLGPMPQETLERTAGAINCLGD